MLQQDNIKLSTRHANISERKRLLLEKRLRGGRTNFSEAPSIPRLSRQGPVPLSLTQQGLWILDQLMVDSPVYNVFTALRFTGSLHIPVLQRSLDAIVLRHETLRTNFQMIEGQPMQVIAGSLSIPLSIIDLREHPQIGKDEEVQRLAAEEARRPFTLTEEPLLRATVIRVGADSSLLLLTIHHIISDGWSIGILVDELTTLYDTYTHNLNSPLTPLPIQYADFATWQRKILQGGGHTEHLAYWKQQLAGSPKMLTLPTNHPHLPTLTAQGSSYQMTLSPRLTRALKELSQQEEVTLYMTLVAAFQTLLCRYSGQEEIVIGTASAGRTQEEIEPLIGFFINTLVLRTSLAGHPTFKELLQRVRTVVLEAQQHQAVPFEILVKELQPERQLGQNPFFQVMLTLDPSLPNLPKEWTLAPIKVESQHAKFDLLLELEELPNKLIANFEYRTDLFDPAVIARMAGHFHTLLEGIIAEPEQQVTALPILTAEEKRCLLEEWNATQAAYPQKLCVHELFEQQVQRTPEAVAVVFEGTQLTYRELNQRANQLAYYLRQQGVRPDMLIGLCVERSLEMVIGLLGILKAGGAYVPLDPAYPIERLTFMLEDAQVAVLVTQRSLLNQFPQFNTRVICLDTNERELASQSIENPAMSGPSNALAYVIYTSGSTGRPKGVQISHRAVVNFLLSMRQQPGLQAEDILLAVTTLSFDIAALEIFLPLITGAHLVVASQDVAKSGTALAEILDRTGTTVLQATPVTWRILLASGWQGNKRLKALCGGEAVPLDLAQQLVSKVASLFNMYGPTETTIWSSVHEIKPHHSFVSVGRPIANTQIYLLDEQLQLVPIGVPGELYIGGDGLAHGYLHRPELTEERFIGNPFSAQSGDRIYKTGDLARYRADGTIELVGRIDHQVKIRGFRIELGEIEATLRQHPRVREAVVVAREDTPGDKRLIAYLLAAQESLSPPTSSDLRRLLATQLPDYMLPSAFMFLQAFPLTSNGKVDRQALPAPDFSSAVKDTFVAPKHMLHFQLIAIWEELLNVHSIGIEDNFFNLGGHSLLAMLLLERIEQVLHQKLQLSTLFANPTIAGLAEALQTKVGNELQLPIIAIQTGEAKRPFFFLHGQWRGDAFYCYPLAKAVGKEQPFYAIPPYQLSGATVAPTIEEIAASHIKILQSVQPHGPYMLGGWCNGALVAYEMARQLHTQGQAIDSLILINPSEPSVRLKRVCKIIDRIGRLLHLSLDKQLNCFLRINHLAGYLLYADYRETVEVEQLRAAIRTRWSKWGGKSGALLSRLQLLFPPIETLHTYPSIFTWTLGNYKLLGQYPGKITFFWHRDEFFEPVAWQRVIETNEVEQYYLPGTHNTLLTDHLSDVAWHMQFCLNEVKAMDGENTRNEAVTQNNTSL